MVKKELADLSKVMDISESKEKLEKNFWICPKCKVEWSFQVKYCRKCNLKERIERKRAKYLIK